MKAECLHPVIEPVSLIGERCDERGFVTRYIQGSAMACSACHQKWPYADPEDLPHWLWERARTEGWLPMPRLTPEVMKALQQSAVRRPGDGS